MVAPIAGISSKATAALLAELAARYERLHSAPVRFESVGGVDAARRVRDGEAFDVVVLDASALDALAAAGCVIADTRRPVVRSRVVAAVREGAPVPDIGTIDGLKKALLAARSIGYSTGPSGQALKALLESWGLTAPLADKLRQAPPGVPVGSLIAKGEVDLGFQQTSELMGLPGVRILALPPGAEIISTFSAGVCSKAKDRSATLRFAEFLASPEVAEDKRRHGFEPA